MGGSIIFFDLETQKLASEVGGWGNIARMPAGSYVADHALHELASPYNCQDLGAGCTNANLGTQLSDHGFEIQETPVNFDGTYVESTWANSGVFQDFPSILPADVGDVQRDQPAPCFEIVH